MLRNYKLLLDNDCPMCKVYGRLFVKLNLIEASSLTSFQYEFDNNISIDRKRAKSEIAFYNITTKETVYGVDAIVKIVSQNFTLLEKFLQLPFIHAILKFIYFFISYNRKQIIPVRETIECYDCTPEFKLGYRWTYIIFAALVTGVILNTFFGSLLPMLSVEIHYLTAYVICFGQIAWQYVAIKKFAPKKWIDYLGNMSTVSLLGGILLLPIILLNTMFYLAPVFKLVYFFCVVSIMVVEHLRRCFLLEISHLMTASWIAYRMFVLVILFLINYIF